MARVAVLGAGSWGTALAQGLVTNGHEVVLWGRNEENQKEMAITRENSKYLPGVKLLPELTITSEWPAIANFEFILIAVPTQQQRNLLEAHKNEFSSSKAILINVAKGIEISSKQCLHEVYNEILGKVSDRYVVFYGPSHAEEFGLNMPTALVSASENEAAAEAVQTLFMNENTRVYTSQDVIGVELGGALKNIIALAIGMTVGLGYGDNAQAALITRGLTEITRLGVALGANPYTFLGLTGVGDLIVTCNSTHSRNRRAGIMIGEGKSLDDVLQNMGMVVEGVSTTKAVFSLAKNAGVDMPITFQLYHVLFENGDARQMAKDLMIRTKKSEVEEFRR